MIDTSSAKELVVKAFQAFGKNYQRLIEAKEAETRCDLIDRILTAVGWEQGGFSREVNTGTGDYVDYEVPRKNPILIIEAKRTGISFRLDEIKLEAGRTRALQTLMKTGGQSLRDAIKQAAGYCNDRAIPYACVTNGYQWVFFRGLSSEAHSWTSSRAIVFPSAEDLIANFDDFLACIAPHKVESSELPRLLARPTSQEIPRAITPLDNLTLRRKSPPKDVLDIRRAIGEQFFAQIHGNDRAKMLAGCYVEPGGRPEFNRSLQRLLEDTIATDFPSDDPVYEGDTKDFADRVQRLDIEGHLHYPILVVGNVGVGKTTFLYRTLATLREVADEKSAFEKHEDYKTSNGDAAMFAYVDLENQGNLESFDDQEVQRQMALSILERLEQSALATLKKRDDISDNACEAANSSNPTTLRTMLRKELETERSIGEAFFNAHPQEWIKREYEIFQNYRKDSVTFLIHYVRHLRARFKRRNGLKYPILLIIDNLDQASSHYQRCMYGLALRLAKETPAVTIVSIREDTFREGRQERGFLSSSPLEFVFHVQAPALDSLLRQRLKYIRHCIQRNILPRGLRNASDELTTVADTVSQGLTNSPRQGLEVISALSGHNIRSALRIVREFVLGTAFLTSSPEATVDYLLDSLIAMAGQLEHQLDLKKLFDAEPYDPPLHALRLRLLGYYSWAYETHPQRSLLEDTESVIAKFAAWGYPVHSIEYALKSLCDQGLLTPMKQINSDSLSPRISISPIGYAHVALLASKKIYQTTMALISRWYDPDLAKEFIKRANEAGSEDGTSLGDIVAANAVSIFEAYLGAMKAREDKLLSEQFYRQEWVRETLSRSNAWSYSSISKDEVTTAQETPQAVVMQQLLFSVEQASLSRLPRDFKLNGSMWVPRILWALEYAAINRMGPVTAAQIARILTQQGDVDVPNTNVARAFRDFKGKPDIEVYFSCQGKRYSITKQGSDVIRSCIQSMYSEGDEAVG